MGWKLDLLETGFVPLIQCRSSGGTLFLPPPLLASLNFKVQIKHICICTISKYVQHFSAFRSSLVYIRTCELFWVKSTFKIHCDQIMRFCCTKSMGLVV